MAWLLQTLMVVNGSICFESQSASIMEVHLLEVCHADLGFLQTNTQTRICLKEECHIHLMTWG